MLLMMFILLKLIGLPGSPLAPIMAEDSYLAYAQDNGRTIHFGETLSGDISVKGEKDSYTFQAIAGDTVMFRLSTSWPYGNIELYSPDGYQLENIEMKVKYFTKTLPSTGTYRLTISDRGDFFTGSYSIFVQCINNPSDAMAITYGKSAPGTIRKSADAGTYTFTGRAGDVILARVGGGVWGNIWIYGPDSALVDFSDQASGELLINLPADGRYTLLAGDKGAFFTGDYNVYVQRLNNPGSVTWISYGKTISGQISSPAQMDTYVFRARAGDEITARMSSNGIGNFRLYSPAGALMESVTDDPRQFSTTLPEAGNYTLLAGSKAMFSVGSYSVSLQSPNGGNDPSGSGEMATAAPQASSALPSTSDNTIILIGAGIVVLVILVVAFIFLFGRKRNAPGTTIPDITQRAPPATNHVGGAADMSTALSPTSTRGNEPGPAFPTICDGGDVEVITTGEPTDILCNLINARGVAVLDDPGVFGSLLRDYYHGRFRRETNLLIKSVEERIPQELLMNKVMLPVTKKRLEKRLTDIGFDRGLSAWTVNAWVKALGLDKQ